MKKYLIICGVLVLCLVTGAMGQEMVVGGNMEDESIWTVYHLNSDVEAEYEFNFTDDKPAEGIGGCLWVYGGTTQEINILFWQEITLVGGNSYEIAGAFKDMTGGALNQFWTDVILSPEAPVEGVNYRPPNDTNGDIRVSMNTWSGCGSGTDGTFQDDGCSGTGALFTLPDSIPVGEEIAYYFGIKPGVYAGGPYLEFEILIDEMSLTPYDDTGITADHSEILRQFELYPNFPNPFNPETRISYSLKEMGDVSIHIYNMSGQLIKTLISGQTCHPGEYHVVWDARDEQGVMVGNGVYLCQMRSSHVSQTQKMILTK